MEIAHSSTQSDRPQPRRSTPPQAVDQTRVLEANLADVKAQLAALGRSQAMIEFDLDGTVRTANDNFLKTVGYSLPEIQGQHHRMFCAPELTASHEYTRFWQALADGKFQAGEFRRFARGGREVWLQASYNPVFDERGRPCRVVKIASDITEAKLQAADARGQLEAIGKSQAVIEFELDGTVRTANDNFLKTLGYSLSEIRGQHHRMFCDAKFAASAEYANFWADLRAGRFQSGEYERRGKNDRRVWIQATYNPILDANGKPFKVVKYATDVTATRTLVNEVATTATTLGAAAEELMATSKQMSHNAETTSGQAIVVAAAAEQVNRNVQTVAAATTEMSASIREIAQNASEAARVATGAVTVAATTNKVISKLGDSSAEIGKVVKVITAIAQQTNLLALNATIEAARAGDAGKGFAVVANEVKELAKETARATEDISRKIEAIQSDTQSAVSAIGQIGEVVGKINDIQTAIASAVEEQTATTNEINRNISEAAKGSANIADNITGVARAAQDTSQGTADTSRAASELARMANQLQMLVDGFLR